MKIGPYEIVAEIGRGGMGVVYKARSTDGAVVAVKLLLELDDDKVAHFERERRLVGGFTARDGFVPLLDAGTVDGRPYLVMPFVEGATLRHRLAEGRLGVGETVALGRALASALARAHAKGIVHRDLKPENILFTRPGTLSVDDAGTPLVADLGIAKHFDILATGASQSVALSVEGTLKGTAGYMPPEQMEDARSAAPPADVFALGSILYECLAGRPAFDGATLLQRLDRVQKGQLEPLRVHRPDAPLWLAQVVERALAGDPVRRFPDASVLLFALRAPERERLRLGLVALGAGAVLVAVGLLLGALVFRTGAPKGAVSSSKPAPVTAPVASPVAAGTAVPPEVLSVRQLVELGRERLAAKDWATAIEVYTRAIEADPRTAIAWHNRAVAKVELRYAGGAISDATRAIELDPRDALAFYVRASAREQKGDLSGAEVDLSQAIRLDARDARFWKRRSAVRAGSKDHDGAVADATRVIELDPGDAEGWIERGIAKDKLRDRTGAIADLTRAVELRPGDALCWYNRGLILESNGERERALADLGRAIELEPSAVRWKARALVRSRKGDRDGAIADFTEALALDPRESQCWSDRGAERLEKGDLDGAIADATRAIELDAGFAPAWGNRGSALSKKGSSEAAIADLERFLELAPESRSAPAVRTVVARMKRALR